MMGQVYVIESEAEKRRRKAALTEAQHPAEPDRNPATAATLSLLIWGMGQFYTGKSRSSLLYFLFMINFGIIVGLQFFYWSFFATFLEKAHIDRSNVSFVIGAICVTGLLIWVVNIIHAYYCASINRSTPYEGTGHPFLATFCSVLIPGWGQLVNGQPKKAMVFLIFAAIGLAAGTATILAALLWPRFISVDDRVAVEWLFVAAVFVAPPFLLIWLVGIYDAAKVGWDPVKKEPMRKRFEYAINRIRIKGLARGFLPHAKMFLMLTLLLILSGVVGYYYFPVKNYAPVLETLEIKSKEDGMVLIPYLIGHLRLDIENGFRDPSVQSPPTNGQEMTPGRAQ